jgi:hypothetical protein
VVSSCQRVGSQERSYPLVFPWISLSIHLGGVKWIIISGKDFDRPGWIKRFFLFCNYIKELLWFSNQKLSCCITQVCLYESLIFLECLFMVPKAIQLLATLSRRIVVKRGTIAYQIWNFLCSLRYLDVFHAVISIYVYEHSLHELTMRYSILEKIHLSRFIPSFL